MQKEKSQLVLKGDRVTMEMCLLFVFVLASKSNLGDDGFLGRPLVNWRVAWERWTNTLLRLKIKQKTEKSLFSFATLLKEENNRVFTEEFISGLK